MTAPLSPSPEEGTDFDTLSDAIVLADLEANVAKRPSDRAELLALSARLRAMRARSVSVSPVVEGATEQRMAAIEARLKAAPNRWSPDECGIERDPADGYVSVRECQSLGDTLIQLGDTYDGYAGDWLLAAHAPDDIAWLVAELRDARRDREAAVRELREARSLGVNAGGPMPFARPKVYLDTEEPGEWRCVEGQLQSRISDDEEMQARFLVAESFSSNAEWLDFLDREYPESAANARLAIANPMTAAEAEADDDALWSARSHSGDETRTGEPKNG